jgi:hypothetical protein
MLRLFNVLFTPFLSPDSSKIEIGIVDLFHSRVLAQQVQDPGFGPQHCNNKRIEIKPSVVTHTCNPSYSGG